MRKSGILIGLALLCAGASLAVVLPGEEPQGIAIVPSQDSLAGVTAAAPEGANANRRLVLPTE